MRVTKKEENRLIIDGIKKSGYESFDTDTGTFYIVDKNGFSFHLFFVYNDEVFVQPTYDEIFYDLKNRQCWLRRNDKPLAFSEDNIRKSFGHMPSGDLAFLEVEESNKLFQKAYEKLGKMNYENTKMVSRFLVRLMYEYPILENIHKVGMNIDSVFYDLVNPKSLNLAEAFGFTLKSQLKLYRVLNQEGNSRVSAYVIRSLTEENINYIFHIRELAEKLDKKYGLNKSKSIQEMLIPSYGSFADSRWNSFRYKDVKPYVTVDEERLLEYLFYEVDVRQGIVSSYGAMSTYHDYVKQAAKLGKKFEKYPKSLMLRHDIVTKYSNLMNCDEESAKKFAATCEKVKYLEGKIGNTGYSIVVPTMPADLVDEGEQLSHCVKSYIEAIVNGTCNIVFLRKSKTLDEALYTIEVRDNKIVQFAGFQNCEPDDDAKAAITKLAKSYSLIEEWEGMTT